MDAAEAEGGLGMEALGEEGAPPESDPVHGDDDGQPLSAEEADIAAGEEEWDPLELSEEAAFFARGPGSPHGWEHGDEPLIETGDPNLDAMDVLLKRAGALSVLCDAKVQDGAQLLGADQDFFSERAADDLVEQVLRAKDESLRQATEENEGLKKNLAELEHRWHEERAGFAQFRIRAEEALQHERRVSEQLRKQNRPLRTKLQETINVIRTALAGEPGEHGEEGEQDSDSRLLRKLLHEASQLSGMLASTEGRSLAQSDAVDFVRLDQAERLFESGNELLGAKKCSEATDEFSKSLDLLDSLIHDIEALELRRPNLTALPAHAQRIADARELTVSCMMQSAKCFLANNECRQCVVMCTNVLSQRPNHAGALLYRGMARTVEGPLKHARLDLSQAQANGASEEKVAAAFGKLQKKEAAQGVTGKGKKKKGGRPTAKDEDASSRKS